MKRTAFFAVLLLFFTSTALAGEPTLRERVIGAAFKGLANTFLAAYDLEKGKKEALGKLEAMSDETFVKGYAEAWSVLEGLPEDLRVKNGIYGTMTRSELITRVNGIQKQELRDLVNAVPDEAVSREFDAYTKRMGDKIRQSDTVQQVQKTWQEVLDRIGKIGQKAV
ncbi:MAG: hypothetical protein KTQ49_02825 [Candidatus Omnitrophica bacterium]|nr:hypothetical protein [Candidatus Omnitrophota bacterium]